MIKKLLVWGLCFSVFNNIIAQPLEGKWVGYFETNNGLGYQKVKIMLLFSSLSDSVFNAVSVTYLKDGDTNLPDTVVCKIAGYRFDKDSIFLEETRYLSSTSKKFYGCLQKMELRFSEKRKEYILEGKWVGKNENCGSGEMWLSKKLVQQ
jgi:hypothetical protein